MGKLVASRIMMVKPKGFAYNHETAASNAFQNKPDKGFSEIQALVNIEFNAAVSAIREAGVDVIIFEEPSGIANPDALFPNNWFSSQPDGTLVIYPMASEMRRKERHISWLESLMENELIPDSAILDLSHNEEIERYLEGTGSIVFDHQHKIAFAGLSERTDKILFEDLCQVYGYEAFSFETDDGKGLPIYHTNVMMSVCPDWAIVCTEVITNQQEAKKIEKHLSRNSRPILKINKSQMTRFAGNVLALESEKGKKLILISTNAYTSLDEDQQKWINNISIPVIVNIPTIESVGGGGIRCMVAELFS